MTAKSLSKLAIGLCYLMIKIVKGQLLGGSDGAEKLYTRERSERDVFKTTSSALPF